MELHKLTTCEIGYVFRRAFALASVDLASPGLSWHSARVGANQDMIDAGMTTAVVQIAGRWKSERMPIHYAAKLMAKSGKKRFRKLRAWKRGREAG
jgi:hypothetical protein